MKIASGFTGVSVVIPYYNDEACLRKCLDAIYAATLCLSVEDRQRLEVIVVDDASPSPFFCEKAPPTLGYLRLEDRRGAGAARNAGASRAKYSHLFFIDSDVLLDKHYLAVVFEILKKREVNVLQGVISATPANDNPRLFHHYLAVSWNFFFQYYWWCGGWTMCTVFADSFFSRLGGFCEDYPDSGGEEFELAARLQTMGTGVVALDKRLLFYHHYDCLSDRLQKVWRRRAHFRNTFSHYAGVPLNFKVQAGVRVVFALVLTLLLLFSFIVQPLLCLSLYALTGTVFFLVDGQFSRHMCRQHSWWLALSSIFFRQLEYMAVLSGLLHGMVRSTSVVMKEP